MLNLVNCAPILTPLHYGPESPMPTQLFWGSPIETMENLHGQHNSHLVYER